MLKVQCDLSSFDQYSKGLVFFALSKYIACNEKRGKPLQLLLVFINIIKSPSAVI